MLGERAWPSLAALPEVPDHAYILSPTETVIAAVEECGQAGVSVVTIFASGFGEAGHEGVLREQKLQEIVARTEVETAAGADRRLDAAVAGVRKMLGGLADPERAQLMARSLAERMALVLQGSLLVRLQPPRGRRRVLRLAARRGVGQCLRHPSGRGRSGLDPGARPSGDGGCGRRRGLMPVRVERAGPVTTVVLSRPASRNAVDGATAAQLAAAFREFDEDDGARAAVLWGEGGTFCSGADLKAIGTERGNRVAPDGDGPMGPTRMRLGKPVIAAVAGHAVAGGLELALWCDLRVAEEDAVFGVFCRRWGVPLIDGGTVRLPRLIGASRAMDLVLTGRPVPAAEALDIGLVNRVVPAGTARAEAELLAAEIARFPQACLRSDRASLLDQEGRDERSAMAEELRYGQAVLAESMEGAARFAAGAGRHGAPEG